jgi:hypothetical protein
VGWVREDTNPYTHIHTFKMEMKFHVDESLFEIAEYDEGM